MPSRRVHVKFDKYLIAHGLVGERNYLTVHARMDRDLQIHGHWNHRYEDFYHDVNGVRAWIRKWSHLGYQETLTDYVRVALGHLVLDEMWSKYEYENEYELIKSAYRSYVQRGFDRCLFRET
jgi:hypothetical protein